MSDKPILLLDVDGVVSVWSHGQSERPLSDFEFVLRYSSGVVLRVPHGIKDRLARLEQAYEVWWCTGWEASAARVLHPHLGDHVLDWMCIRWPNRHEASLTNCNWKIATIHAAVGMRPVAWVDDNIGPEAHEWATTRSDAHPTTVIKTESHVGLLDVHTEQLLDWAASLTTGCV